MKNILYILGGLSLLASCTKDDIALTRATTRLDQLQLDNRPTQQRFTFALAQPQAIRTASGATFTFPANAFLLPDGTAATGQAELRLIEIYSVGDMLLANQPTNTPNGTLLISGGEFRIQVWQGTDRLTMRTPQALTDFLSIASTRPAGQEADTTRMRLWTNTQQPDSSGRTGWNSSYSGTVTPTPSLPYYTSLVPLDSMGWWNIDQLPPEYYSRPASTIRVSVPAGATLTRVYLRPVGQNGLAMLWNSDATNYTSGPMPLGMAMVAVVLQERDSKLYYGTQTLTVQATNTITLTPAEHTAAEIVSLVRQL